MKVDFTIIENCLPLFDREIPKSLIIQIMDVFVNFVDTNPKHQQLLANKGIDKLIQRLVHYEDAQIVDSACLLVSHLVWNNFENQNLFCSDDFIKILLNTVNVSLIFLIYLL